MSLIENSNLIFAKYTLYGEKAVEIMEREGTQAAAATNLLPTGSGSLGEANSNSLDWLILRAWGVKPKMDEVGNFLPAPGDDSLFVECELPEGWAIRTTDHSMWNYLVDTQGHARARCFYKAAFYDRKAFIRTNVVHTVELEYPDTAPGAVRPTVTRFGEIIFTGDLVDDDDLADAAGREWANANIPGWQSPLAHWDGEPPVVHSGDTFTALRQCLGSSRYSLLGPREPLLGANRPWFLVETGNYAVLIFNRRPLALYRITDTPPHATS